MVLRTARKKKRPLKRLIFTEPRCCVGGVGSVEKGGTFDKVN